MAERSAMIDTLRHLRRLSAAGAFATDLPVEAVDSIEPEPEGGSRRRTLARLLAALGLSLAAAALLRRAAGRADDGGGIEPPF